MTPFQYERTNFTNDESCPDIDPDYFNKVEEGFKDAEVSINELNEFAEDTNDHLAASDTAIAANSEALATAQNEIAVLDSFKEYDPDFSYDKYWPCFYDGIPYRSLHDDNVGPNNIPPDTLGTHWEVVGGGSGAGNVGYNFTGGQMDNGVAMYTGYKDAAQATPVDGTGGTVTTGHTFAKNTTDPIIGIADALWSKPAANCQGEGYSCPFSIDEGRRSGPAQITFDYKTLEGYVDSDAGAYVYDVDNGAILTISVNLIPSTNQRAAQFIASFVPSSSKNYRLCFHVASTSVTPWGMRIDNIVIEEKRITQGAAIGAWKAFLPGANITNLPGSWSQAYYRRNGESADLFLKYLVSGAATGALSLTTNDLLSSLGLTINQPDQSIAGATAYDASSSSFYVGLWNPVIGKFRGPSSADWSASVPYAWASGDVIGITVSVQIAQWTGNGTIGLVENYEEYASNDGSGGTAANTNYTSGSVNLIEGSPIPAVATSAVATATSYRCTFPSPIMPTDDISLEIDVSGAGAWIDSQLADSGGMGPQVQSTVRYGMFWTKDLTDTTGRSVRVYFNNGGAIPIGASYGLVGYAWSNFSATRKFRARKVSSGKPGQELPLIRAEYTGSTTLTPSSTIQQIPMTTKVVDTHSCVSGNAFVASITGYYQVEVTLGSGAVTTTAAYITVPLLKNAVSFLDISASTAPANQKITGGGTKSLFLQAGDSITVGVYGNPNTSGNFTNSRIAITLLGK
jgi:hypothetical protein